MISNGDAVAIALSVALFVGLLCEFHGRRVGRDDERHRRLTAPRAIQNSQRQKEPTA